MTCVQIARNLKDKKPKKQSLCKCGCPKEAHGKSGECLACCPRKCLKFVSSTSKNKDNYIHGKCGRVRSRSSERCMDCMIKEGER